MKYTPSDIPTHVDATERRYAWSIKDVNRYSNYELLPLDPFRAELKIRRSVGRSSCTKVDLVDEGGTRYKMFMTDFIDLVADVGYDPAVGFEGTWAARRLGSGFGIFRAGD